MPIIFVYESPENVAPRHLIIQFLYAKVELPLILKRFEDNLCANDALFERQKFNGF